MPKSARKDLDVSAAVAAVPESRLAQLRAQLRRLVPEGAEDASSLSFDDLPPETRALFDLGPSSAAVELAAPTGPLRRRPTDQSIICTHPEWRTYWRRQGLLTQMCDTAQAVGETLRKLRGAYAVANAQRCRCEEVMRLVTELYGDRVHALHAVAELRRERAVALAEAAALRVHLRGVARELQHAYPLESDPRGRLLRGLGATDGWNATAWRALMPHLPESVNKVIAALARCNARLRGSTTPGSGTPITPGLDARLATAQARLAALEVRAGDQAAALAEANRRLAVARDLVKELVHQTTAMGYSLRRVAQEVNAESPMSLQKLLQADGPQFEFNAPAPPRDVAEAAVGPASVRATLREVQSVLASVSTTAGSREARRPSPIHPFPVPNAWHD